MKLYSLENIERTINNDNLYDIYYPMLKDNPNIRLKEYIVREEREMRLDLICMDLYGSTNYIDELMYINGIIDPYSVKKDDIIYYADTNSLTLTRKNYEGNKKQLEIESNQKNEYGKNLTTSTPDDFRSVIVDTEKKEISITNKLR